MTSDRPAPAGGATPFRNRGGVAMLVICAVLAAALLIDAAVRAGIGTALLMAPWLLLVLWGVHVVGVASRVRPQPDAVFVQNLLRRTWAPWARVEQIRMRWQIELSLDDGTVLACFGGPARRRPQRLGPGRRLEDAAGDADDAVAALRKAKAEAGAGPDGPIRRGWDVPAIVALGVLIAWAVVAVLIVNA